MVPFLNRLREKPVREKRFIAIGVSAGATLLIFVIWFMNLQFSVDDGGERTPGFFEGLRFYTGQFIFEAGEVVSETEKSYKEGDLAKLIEYVKVMEGEDLMATTSDPEMTRIQEGIMELLEQTEELQAQENSTQEKEELYFEMLKIEEELFVLINLLKDRKEKEGSELVEDVPEEEDLLKESFEEEEF